MKHYLNQSILLVFIIMISIAVQAQDDRKNANLPVIGDKVLWSLSEATGWIKNNEGQWLEGKNIVYEKHLSAADKSMFSEGRNILGKDNFIKYELRNINIGGIELLLFTKSSIESGYDYPSTKMGWKPLKVVYYVVIKKGVAKSRQNSFDTKALTYESKGYFRGSVDLKEDYLHNIALEIAANDQRDAEFKTLGILDNLVLDYKLLMDGKTCRFRIYSSGSSFDIQPKERVGVMHDHAMIFQDYYFECPKEKLDGLLQLISFK